MFAQLRNLVPRAFPLKNGKGKALGTRLAASKCSVADPDLQITGEGWGGTVIQTLK